MTIAMSPRRRQLVLAALSSPFAGGALAAAGAANPYAALPTYAALEQAFGGRVGVCLIDTASGAVTGHRADERFAMCSSFKAIAAAAILARSVAQTGLLDKRIAYTSEDLVSYSPVTEQHVGDGMTIGALCAATVQYSDNGAANLLLRELGGPAAVTAFARSAGDMQFRLDRWETELNSAVPGDPRDTTTPAAMAALLKRLVLGDGLPPAQQRILADWLIGNKTGDARIRAAVPARWRVGDKTGTGGVYGAVSDIAVLWPDGRAPLVLAVYTGHTAQAEKGSSELIAAAARIALAGVI